MSHGKGFPNFSSVCKTLFKGSGQSLKLGRVSTVKLAKGETKESRVGLVPYGETRNKIKQNPGETAALHPRSPLPLEETQHLSGESFLQVYALVAFFFFNCKIPGRLAPLKEPGLPSPATSHLPSNLSAGSCSHSELQSPISELTPT